MNKFLLLALALPLAACGSDSQPTANAAENTPAVEAEPMTIEASTHNVKCGCVIESIGACGNYVEFDGEYAMIANSSDMDLGKMEWCGQEGVTAEVAGTRTGEYFTATSITVNE